MSFCQIHPQNQVDFICTQQHNCQRKLCKDCLSDHIENMKQAVTIEKFQKIVNEKWSVYQSDNKDVLTQQKKSFQSLLYNIEVQIQIVLEELHNSITKIYDKIEQQDQSYNQLINENNNLTKSSNDSLNKLISIVQGKSLENWNSEKTNYLEQLEKAKQQLNSEVEIFKVKIQQWLKEIFEVVGIKNKEQVVWQEGSQVQQIVILDQVCNRFIYSQFQVKFTKEKEVQYLRDGEILRIDQIKDTTKKPEILINLKQLQNLKWSGQYNCNNQKVGKWIATWKDEIIKDVGGKYSEEGNKQGSWQELFENRWIQILQYQETNIYEQGDYDNGIRVRNWKYIYDNKEIGGGNYSENGEKNGNWQEPWEKFWQHSQLYYIGQYQNGNKVGRWDIQYKENEGTKLLKLQKIINQSSQCVFFSGGGLYDLGGNGMKQGSWVEISEGFFKESQVTYNGQYKNGKKVGGWDICKIEKSVLFGFKFQKILYVIFASGGGVYDRSNGIKQGNWVEISHGFFRDSQVIYSGQYKNDKKVARWDILFKENEDKRQSLKMQQIYVALLTFVFSGGGEYDDGIKQGDWVEISDGFFRDSQVTYRGQYKNGKKIARWDIWYKEIGDNGKNLKIGGGVYDEGGNGIKLGDWVEISDGFFRDSQIIYEGQYQNGKKVARWDICNIEKSILNDNIKSQKMQASNTINISRGGGLYEAINQTRTGDWIALSDEFSNTNQIIYHGEYKNGSKVGRWEVLKMNQKDQFELKQQNYLYLFFRSFLMFDQNGIELFTKNQYKSKNYNISSSNIILSGKINNGKKCGKWHILYGNIIMQNNNIQQKNVHRGGGQYGQQGLESDGVKYGRWVEISDEFSYNSQVMYDGEYQNGKKVGRWDIYQFVGNYDKMQQIQYKKIMWSGFIIYDFQGNPIQQEKRYQIALLFLVKQPYFIWVTSKMTKKLVSGMFGLRRVMGMKKMKKCKLYSLQFYNMWIFSGEGYYDDRGDEVKFGPWVEIIDGFCDRLQITYKGQYKNGRKIGRWDIQYNEFDSEWKNQIIGGGFYDQEGSKFGKWIEQSENFSWNSQVTYQGNYKNRAKIGIWEVYYKQNGNLKEKLRIGGGSYGQEGSKSGKWIEESDNFKWDFQVIYQGNYRNGKKIGEWGIYYRKQYENEYKQIGGGIYDEKGNGTKSGKWNEQSGCYKWDSEVIYQGKYGNGKKIGEWNILYRRSNEDKFRKIGGGSYDNDKVGDEFKLGKWVEISDEFNYFSQVTSSGEYQNGKKFGTWIEKELQSNEIICELKFEN